MEWIDPKSVKHVRECKRYVLFGEKYWHKIGEFKTITSDGIKETDGKSWELFRTRWESDDYYWGMPIEGLGMLDCMCPKSSCRELSEREKKTWSKRTMGMFGSHTGKLSYTFELGEME